MNEIEAREVEFRLFIPKEKKPVPFISLNLEEVDLIYAKVLSGEITNKEAIEEITKIMEKYYGKPYRM